jgi:polyketide synthase PksN
MGAWSKNLPFALSGVIHAAGIESDQAFFEKSSGDIDRVLHPKTTGTRLLDDVLESQSLDFICYFSSSSALLGDFGSCDYAIANRFQMAYGLHCQQRSRENGRTIVINWPLWQEGGMGVADPEQTALYLKRTGLSALGTDDGLQIWDELVSDGQRQTLVMAGQPSRIVALMDKLYPLQQPSQTLPGTGIPRTKQVHKTNGVARDRRRVHQPGNLNMHQVERLKQLLKADLLSLQEAGE